MRKYPRYVVTCMSDDWVIDISRAFWKCLFNTSRMALAKPHRKKSDVISTNGTIYRLSVSVGLFIFIIVLWFAH